MVMCTPSGVYLNVLPYINDLVSNEQITTKMIFKNCFYAFYVLDFWKTKYIYNLGLLHFLLNVVNNNKLQNFLIAVFSGHIIHSQAKSCLQWA